MTGRKKGSEREGKGRQRTERKDWEEEGEIRFKVTSDETRTGLRFLEQGEAGRARRFAVSAR